MSDFLRRTWANIRLDAIRHNYQAIAASLAAGSRVMAIVKADAYGHGACYVARALEEAGAPWFGVSNLDEALQLRDAGIAAPILILSYTPPDEAARLAAHGIRQAVPSLAYAQELSHQAQMAGVRVRIHIKLDTGMARLGLCCLDADACVEAADEAVAVCRLPHLEAEGVFTHFASADEETGAAFTRQQFARFRQTLDILDRRGVVFPLRHCCNSAATMLFPDMHLDLVRPGLILYGLAPSPYTAATLPLRPAMELKTVISMVKTIPAGTTVSYNRTFTAPQEMRIATVPIGYADGYPRCLSNRASMLVAGCAAPVVGRVCMDQCMLDVTAIPTAREGMPVTVFGCEGDARLPVEEVAALCGTINYETVCLVGKRVPRIFLDGDTTVGRLNYLVPAH